MLSIIVSVYNEQESLGEFNRQVLSTLRRMDVRYEIIYVNDGSSDRSREILEGLAELDAQLTVVNLSRNFGHESAMQAGLDHSSGDYAVMMDADLQSPPSLLPEIYGRLLSGNDVVFCVRENYATSWWRKACSDLFYRFVNVSSRVEMIPNLPDFFAISRKVIESINQMKEKGRFLRGLVTWTGFRRSFIPYTTPRRFAGSSKYGFFKLLELSMDAAISFSGNPLRKFALLGFFVSFGAMLYGLFIAALFIFWPEILIPGWATVVDAILFIGGLNLLLLSVLGEYLARTYVEVKGRPLYLVESVYRKEEALANANGR